MAQSRYSIRISPSSSRMRCARF
uniref:Uncharacterized protein n=1 Tax=Arundo donax TaxID=35708 RepID=A0A0A9CAF5_ARUDO